MIDVFALKANVDLIALAGRDTALRHVASTDGGEWAGPCPFCGGVDRFRVQPHTSEGGRWLCRKCTEGKWQDAIGYIMQRESVDFRRACELLGATDNLPARPRPPAPPPERTGPPSAEWQAKARQVIDVCAATLWTSEGARAREWLHRRGLTDDTLRAWHLGLNPVERFESLATWGLPDPNDGKRHAVLLPIGIILPCEVGGNLWFVKVRRAVGTPKYSQVKGSRPALFGAEMLAGHDVGVLTEGEFDMMLLAQECGDLAGVATLGSASANIDLAEWGRYLLPVSRLLVAYHLDGAGRAGAQGLAEMTARARRVFVPRVRAEDKDVTDFWKAGGRLRDWLTFEIARIYQPAHEEQSAHVPICRQPAEVEEAWWARVFAERGVSDPVNVDHGEGDNDLPL